MMKCQFFPNHATNNPAPLLYNTRISINLREATQVFRTRREKKLRMGSCRRRRLLLLPLVLAWLLAEFAEASFFGGGSDTDSDCSRTCESEHCTAAPVMRYGKYCGVSYTGCPGEAPCDALDACCMLHDACVQATDNDYLNMWCNQSLLDCVAAARPSSATTFAGNSCNVTEVADEITEVVEAAVYAKRILRKP